MAFLHRVGLIILGVIWLHATLLSGAGKYVKMHPSSGELHMKLGESEEMKCEVCECERRGEVCDCDGNFKIKKWMKEDEDTKIKGSLYQLNDVTCDDAGFYSCIPEESGVEPGEFDVRVKGKYVEMHPSSGELHMKLGESEEMKCDVCDCEISREVCDCESKCKIEKWTKEDKRTNIKGSFYPLKDVTCDDAGSYSCFPEKSRVNPGKFNVHVEGAYMKATPDRSIIDLKAGEEFRQKCELENCECAVCGNYSITWEKEGNIAGKNKELHLKNVTLDATGQYKCKTNYKGEDYPKCFDVHVEDVYMETNPETSEVDIPKGRSETLMCDLKGCPSKGCEPYQIRWYTENGNGQPPREGNSLLLKNVNYDDTGNYFCNTTYDEQIYQGYFSVHVHGELCIQTTPRNTEVKLMLNGNEDLKCELQGCPRPGCLGYNVTWIKDEIHVTLSRVLPLRNVTYGDAGEYTCQTQYGSRPYSESFQIRIEGKPLGTPTITPQKLIIKVMERFTLICNVSNIHKGIPEGKLYVWWQNGTKLFEEEKQQYSLTPGVVMSEEIFGCALNNEYNSSDIALETVTVEAPPVIESPDTHQTYRPLYNDKDFNVSYTISGSHLKEFSLRNVNKSVEDNKFSLILESLHGNFTYGQKEAVNVVWKWDTAGIELKSCDDVTYYNGYYIVKVEGTAAGMNYTDNSNFSLHVQHPPVWNKAMINDTTPLCQPKTLYCDVCAEPAPTNYTWSFMGEELVNRTDAELIFSNVTKENFGQYSCTVRNTIGIKSFNISLEEEGFALPPVDFEVVSRTSRTLLLSWKLGLMECYHPESFELRYRNESMYEELDIRPLDCNTEGCQHRLQNLQPESTYVLELRAKYDWSQDDRSYSEYVKTIGQTSALPYFKPLETTITEEAIMITWEFGPSSRLIPQHEASGDSNVTVAIFYKKENDKSFMRYPENGNIPAENKSAIIEGNFDTSAVYVIQYEVYEGDQLAIKTPKFGKPPDRNSSANLGIIIGVVIVVFIGIGIASLIAVGIWHHRKRQQKHESGLQPSLSPQSNTGYEGSDYEKLGSNGNNRSEYTELQDVPVPTDASCDDAPSELAPLPSNYEKLTGAGTDGAQYTDLRDTTGGDYEHAYEYIA